MMADHSPRSPAAVAAANGGVDSPLSRRASLPSAWASVVKGDSEVVSSPSAVTPVPSSPPLPGRPSGSDIAGVESLGSEAQLVSSDVNGEGNAGGARRHVWNKPVNGVVEAVPLMGGAVSWPALSESTRPVLRSSSVSSKLGSDGSASSSQASIISQPPQRQANTNAHINSITNSSMPARPRSKNRGGGGGGASSSGSVPPPTNFFRASPPPPPPPPPFPIFGFHHEMIPAMLNTSVRSMTPVGGEASQAHTGNDHSKRNMSRRGNYGTRPRGDGSYHHNNKGGQRDHDRQDALLSHQYGPLAPMTYLPPPLPPGAPPFMGPPPVRIFPGQMSFDMVSPLVYVPTMNSEAFGAMPMVPPPSAPLISLPIVNESPLSNKIVTQIDYYFSDINLYSDKYLKSNMDDQGWVTIALIASFPRVQNLTQDISLILESLKSSTVVEVQGDKVRKCHGWQKWLNPTGLKGTDAGPQSPGAAPARALAESFQGVLLDEGATGSATGHTGSRNLHGEIAAGQAGELNCQPGADDKDKSVEDVQSTRV